MSECSWENRRSSWMSEWFSEARNAMTGYRGVRCCIYHVCPQVRRLVMHDKGLQDDGLLYPTQFGTRSHSLITSTTCLCTFSFRMHSGTQSVPSGSRASNMCKSMSDESVTLYSSPYMRRDVLYRLDIALVSAPSPRAQRPP